MDLTPSERERFREQRVKLGFTHRTLGARIGVSSGTISNIETGRSGQVKREVYAAAYAVLFSSEPPEGIDVELWKRMIAGLAQVPHMWSTYATLAEEQAKDRKPKK